MARKPRSTDPRPAELRPIAEGLLAVARERDLRALDAITEVEGERVRVQILRPRTEPVIEGEAVLVPATIEEHVEVSVGATSAQRLIFAGPAAWLG